MRSELFLIKVNELLLETNKQVLESASDFCDHIITQDGEPDYAVPKMFISALLLRMAQQYAPYHASHQKEYERIKEIFNV